MKTIKNVLGIIALAILMTFVTKSESYAKNVDDIKTQWYNEVTYPITGDRATIANYGLENVIDMLNPPEAVLEKASSEELANLMMKYPLLWIILTYEDNQIDLFYDFLERNCDIYNELLRREDGIHFLLESYRTSDFNIGLCMNNEDILYHGCIEYDAEVFGCEFIKLMGRLINGKDMALAKRIIKEKSDIYRIASRKESGKILSFDRGLLTGGQIQWARNISDNQIMSYSNGFSASGAPNVIKSIEQLNFWFTPGTFHRYDIRVSCLQFASNEGYDANTINRFIKKIAFHWDLLGIPSPKYNCHSYAWIASSTENTIWLDSPTGYINYSPAVDYIGSNIIPRAGDIIVIRRKAGGQITHSAIVDSYSIGGIYVRHKDGGLGLYRSPLSEVMTKYGSSYDVYRTR